MVRASNPGNHVGKLERCDSFQQAADGEDAPVNDIPYCHNYIKAEHAVGCFTDCIIQPDLTIVVNEYITLRDEPSRNNSQAKGGDCL